MKSKRKIIYPFTLVFMLLLTGCASNNAVTYDEYNAAVINEVKVGKVINIRNVYIENSGNMTTLGAVAGGVVGSTVGKGNGKILAALGGAFIGGAIAEKLSEENAQELTVVLDSSKTVVVVSKGTNILVGDRIRIVSVDNLVSTVYKL